MAFVKPIISIQKKKGESLSFDIVTSKKELKRAVERNKVKRRIRASIQSLPKKPYHLKIFTTKGAGKARYSEIHAIIKAHYD
jgi:ribonuclease P protein component